jgi:hypothetical protein
MEIVEQAAGPDQTIVIYRPQDDGTELDAVEILAAVAADAAARAARGARIVTMTVMPLRHGGLPFGLQGSGIETKAAVAVVYAPMA